MSIAFRSQAKFSGTSSGSPVTLTKPTGAASGDILLARIWFSNGAVTVTPPTGWTQIGVTQAFTTAGEQWGWYYKVAGGSEPASYDFTFSGTFFIEGAISAWSGVDNTTPLDIAPVFAAPASQTVATRTYPSITATSVTNGAVFVWVGMNDVTATCTPTTGLTLSSTNDSILSEAYKVQGTAGSSGAITGTAASGQTGIAAAGLLALRPAGSGTAYTASPADALGLTDSGAFALQRVQSKADALGLTDSAAWVLTTGSGTAYTFAAADGIGFTDTGSPQSIGYGETFSDALGLTDAVTAVLQRGISAADPLGLADSFTYVLSEGQLLNATDSLGLRDTAVFVLETEGVAYTFEVDDGLGLTDSAEIAGPPRDITIVVTTGSDRLTISTSET